MGFSSLTDVQITQLKNALGELGSEYEDAVKLAKIKIASANSDMISYIGTWLSGEWNYAQMSPDMQNIARDALFNTDWVSQLPDDVDAGSWDDVSNWLQENFLFAINNIDDAEIQTALSNAFNGIFTVESLQAVIGQLLGTEGFDENNGDAVAIAQQVQKSEYADWADHKTSAYSFAHKRTHFLVRSFVCKHIKLLQHRTKP